MNIKTIFITILILFLTIFADEEAPNKKVIFYDQNKVFTIISTPEEPFFQNKGITDIYKNGNKLYQFSWYNNRIYAHSINNDLFMIRIAQWHRGKVNKDAFEIGFYKNDKTLKEYTVQEILKDVNNVSKSVSHYKAIIKIKGFRKIFNYNNNKEKILFKITTAEYNDIEFEIESGNINQ